MKTSMIRSILIAIAIVSLVMMFFNHPTGFVSYTDINLFFSIQNDKATIYSLGKEIKLVGMDDYKDMVSALFIDGKPYKEGDPIWLAPGKHEIRVGFADDYLRENTPTSATVSATSSLPVTPTSAIGDMTGSVERTSTGDEVVSDMGMYGGVGGMDVGYSIFIRNTWKNFLPSFIVFILSAAAYGWLWMRDKRQFDRKS